MANKTAAREMDDVSDMVLSGLEKQDKMVKIDLSRDPIVPIEYSMLSANFCYSKRLSMVVIKNIPIVDRNTATSYVNLEEIQAIIRDGTDVQIVESKTGMM